VHKALLLSCCSLMVALSLVAARAGAADADAEKLFQDAVSSLARGALDDAIDRFEVLADRGVVNADASFDRALAYVERAKSPAARPGDLGRAVAALEETLSLRPSDAEAEQALERVRGEIARRRARQGAEPVMAKTTLSRAIVAVLPESVWAILAAVGSALLTLGLVMRRVVKSHRTHLAGTTAAAVGAFVLVIGGGFAAAAHHYRVTSRRAVVVAENARLLDDAGRPVVQKGGIPEHVSAPEGTLLFVLERRGELSRIEWGSTEAWMTTSQLVVLPAS
jgi:hypothetical protein